MEHANKFYENLLEDCKLYHPYLADQIVSYQPRGDLSIRITLTNGDKYLYDGSKQSVYRERSCDNDKFTEDFFHKSFTARLDYIMSVKGYSQHDLSKSTGIAYGTISNYKRGKTKPTFYNVCKIARALGCDLSELID